MGKSTLAQRLATGQGTRPFYVATMRPRDAEDDARIARHRAEREGWGFETIECPTGIEGILPLIPPEASILLDSTTALLAEEMFQRDGTMDLDAAPRVEASLLSVADAFEHIIFVSDAIYADGMRYDDATEAYRRGLSAIDRALAARCDAVLEMTFGQRILHKGDDEVAKRLKTVDECFSHGDGALHGPAGHGPVG